MAKKRSYTSGRLFLAAVATLLSLAFLYHTISPRSSTGVARWIHNSPYAWDALKTATVTVTFHAPAPTTIAPVLANEIPAALFKENLRPEFKYITSWPAFGWNNQVMQYMNLIYLGLITERIPILAPFTPNGHVISAGFVEFGEVFDIPRLEEEMGLRILEWSQVKDPNSEMLEDLGCWKLPLVEAEQRKALWRPHNLELDISYTLTPEWVKVEPRPGEYNDMQSTFWSLASLGYPDTRPANSDIEPELSPVHNVALYPDEDVLCFDNLYYVCAHKGFEFEEPYSPAWRFVGRHMHWTSAIQDIADNYTREALGVGPGEWIPPYISAHIRRYDFERLCDDDVPIEDCFAPLSAYVRRVDEVKAEIFSTKGISVDQVIVTGDERDPEWWYAVHELGWVTTDHSQTAERYGGWYPTFIDGAIQSGGLGFVGTWKSTVSILADRRVSAWQNGAVRTVHWGYKGADEND
ncbi:hypothetical protein DFH07DRAFT_794610 [Mycena maculata]|uniref:Uncharacterized protein n=1 Tax=Mycena maculata TaxID=230809 RepID=A0AAD7KAE7_9AGAR|nr:hypothetical protein DFH07DRAFT_794610 [Mycena maculata]